MQIIHVKHKKSTVLYKKLCILFYCINVLIFIFIDVELAELFYVLIVQLDRTNPS